MTSTLTQPESPRRHRLVRHEPVSVLWSRRVKTGREAEFEVWAHSITAAARDFPGHLGASVLHVPGSSEYHILYTFADQASSMRGLTPTKGPAGWRR